MTRPLSRLFLALFVAVSTLGLLGASAGAAVSKRPGAPTNVSVVSGNDALTITWSPPTNTGGGPITGYSLRPIGGHYCSPGGSDGTFKATTCTVTGLRNGRTYAVAVKAFNAYGASAYTTAISEMAGIPGAPTGVSGVPGNGSAAITWAAAAGNGSPITVYTVTSSPGAQSCTSTGLSCTVSGLTNGQSYTFTVTATNKIALTKSIPVYATGPASAPSAPVVLASVPGVPTNVVVRGDNGSALVSFTAPADGGSAITSYSVVVGDETTAVTSTDTAPASTATNGYTVSGLNPADGYTFSVEATNVAGTGAASPATGATPDAPVVTSTSSNGDGTANVSWAYLVPSTYGNPITGYVVTVYDVTPGSYGLISTTDYGSAVSSADVSGLTLGHSYVVDVNGVNVFGLSRAAGTGSLTESAAVPGVPTDVVAAGESVSGSPSAWVTFVAPPSNGSPITGYTVVVEDQTTHVTTDEPAPASAGTAGFTVTDLNPSDSYAFSVIATNAMGSSGPSQGTGATPAAPTSLISSSNGNGTANISWSPSDVTFGTSITGYTVTTLDMSTFTLGPTASAGGSATSASVSGLSLGNSYIACVRAQNAFGTGDNESCTQFTE